MLSNHDFYSITNPSKQDILDSVQDLIEFGYSYQRLNRDYRSAVKSLSDAFEVSKRLNGETFTRTFTRIWDHANEIVQMEGDSIYDTYHEPSPLPKGVRTSGAKQARGLMQRLETVGAAKGYNIPSHNRR